MKKFVSLLVLVTLVCLVGLAAALGSSYIKQSNTTPKTSATYGPVMATKAPVIPFNTATVTATNNPVVATATPAPVVTATPAVVESATPEINQMSWNDFWAKNRSEEGSVNACFEGKDAGSIIFTDDDIYTHVDERQILMFSGKNLTVKLENREYTGELSAESNLQIKFCSSHESLSNFNSTKLGDYKEFKFGKTDIENLVKVACYWYDADGNVVYGIRICEHKYTGNGNGGSGKSDPTEVPATNTPAPEANTPQPPQETPENKPTHNPATKEPEVATSNTPQPPQVTPENKPTHNPLPEEPKVATTNTPQPPKEEATNEAKHSDLPDDESDNEPSHNDTSSNTNDNSNNNADSSNDSTPAPTPTEATGDVPPAPPTDLVTTTSASAETESTESSSDVPPAPPTDLVATTSASVETETNEAPTAPSAPEVPDTSDYGEAENTSSHSDLPD